MSQLSGAPIFVDEIAGADADGSARPRAAPEARARPRPHRRGLPAAHAGRRHQGEPRDRDLGDLAQPQGARQGAEGAGGRAFAAQPRRRAAHRQAAGDVGPARIGRHRAGQRPDPADLPRGGRTTRTRPAAALPTSSSPSSATARSARSSSPSSASTRASRTWSPSPTARARSDREPARRHRHGALRPQSRAGARIRAEEQASSRSSRRMPTATASRRRRAALAGADAFAVARLEEAVTLREAGVNARIVLLEGFGDAVRARGRRAPFARAIRTPAVPGLSARGLARPAGVPGLAQGRHRHAPARVRRGAGQGRGGAARGLPVRREARRVSRPTWPMPSAAEGRARARPARRRSRAATAGRPASAASRTPPGSSPGPRRARTGCGRASCSTASRRSRIAPAPSSGSSRSMTLETRVIALKDVAAGERVGYGGTWTARTRRRASRSPPSAMATAIRAAPRAARRSRSAAAAATVAGRAVHGHARRSTSRRCRGSRSATASSCGVARCPSSAWPPPPAPSPTS